MEFSTINKIEKLIKKNNMIKIHSPGKTDCFIDMFNKKINFNAPIYFTEIKGDFIINCKVSPDFKEIYDAGGIIIFNNNKKWIKLAFEYTDLGYPSSVAVVTNSISDDCNGERIEDKCIWLQAVRRGNNWCLHFAKDKKNWKMIRYFNFIMNKKVKLGVFVQSPMGKGCHATFEELNIMDNNYTDIRKGI